MNHLNRTLAPDVETVYLMSNPQYSFVSSSGVKEVASFGGNVDELVPEPVARRFKEMFPVRQARRARSRRRNEPPTYASLIIVAGCLVLAAWSWRRSATRSRAAAARTLPRYPGRIAVRDGCGAAGTCSSTAPTSRMHVPPGRLRHGQRVAERRQARLGHEGRQRDPRLRRRRHRPGQRTGPARVRTPPRASRPTATKIAFLHSPHERRQVRHLGHVDHGPGRGAADEHAQRLRRRLVPDGRLDRVRPELVGRHARGPDLARPPERRRRAHARARATRRTGRPTGSTSSTSTTARSGWSTPTAPNAHQADSERPRAGLVARRRDDRLHAHREVLAERLPRAL